MQNKPNYIYFSNGERVSKTYLATIYAAWSLVRNELAPKTEERFNDEVEGWLEHRTYNWLVQRCLEEKLLNF